MAKLNFLLSLNSYLDTNSTNNPNLNVIKWTRDFQALAADKPQSVQLELASNEIVKLFDSSRTLTQDGTTIYTLEQKSGNTHILKHDGGTPPNFRTTRFFGGAIDTEISVSNSGDLVLFESIGGSIFDFISAGVMVGDKIEIGEAFSEPNRGLFSIVGFSMTGVWVKNPLGVSESPIPFIFDSTEQIKIYSSTGVQVGDTVIIPDSFFQASIGSYEITAVSDTEIEFYSSTILPTETILTDQIKIYGNAKKLIYIESDGELSLEINGIDSGKIKPIISGTEVKPGMLLKSDDVWSAYITNTNSENIANVYFASVE